jgi:CHAT domain-containing protein/tetratricopeptide (TPR) repeat protein
VHLRVPLQSDEFAKLDVTLWETDKAKVTIQDADLHPLYAFEPIGGLDRVYVVPLLGSSSGDYWIQIESGPAPTIYQIALRPLERITTEKKAEYQIRNAILRGLGAMPNGAVPERSAVLPHTNELAKWCDSNGGQCSFEARYACAEVNRVANRWKEAAACAHDAAEFLDRESDPERKLIFLAEASQFQLSTGNIAESRAVIQRARPLLNRVSSKFAEVFALNEFCLSLISNGENADGKSDCNAALALARQLDFQTAIAESMVGLAQIASGAGSDDVLKLCEDAATIYRKFEDPRGEANALLKELPILSRRRKPYLTLQTAAAAISACQAAGDSHTCWEAYYWSAITYESAGDFEKARANYQEGIDIAEKENDPLTGLQFRIRFINLDFIQRHDATKALADYRDLLKQSQALRADNIETEALVRLGQIESREGQIAEARNHYERALAYYRKNFVDENEQAVLELLGGLCMSERKYADALAYYRESLRIATKLGFPTGIAITLSAISRTERAQGLLKDALADIQESIDTLEAERTDVLSPELRMRFLGETRPYFDEEVDLLLEMHEKDPSGAYLERAFFASEQSKARVLLDIVPTFGEGLRGGISPELLSRANRLRKDLENAKTTGADTHAVSLIEAELDKVQGQMVANDPAYQALKSPPILGADQISRKLTEDSVLVEFKICDRRSVVFVISPQDKLFAAALPGESSLNPLIDSLREAQSAVGTVGADKNYRRAARALSDVILGPIAAKIQHKRLFLVNDRGLLNISFAGLADPSVSGEYQPVIVDHEIVNLPSASVASAIERQRSQAVQGNKNILIFADPAFADHAGSSPHSSAFSYENDLLLNVFPKTSVRDYRGFQASLDSLMAEDLGRYQIIHFATHTDVDEKFPELSDVRLSSVQPNGAPRPGMLRLVDIYNLRLKSELVVLDSCQSAIGRDLPGEGLIAIARGFMYAGSRRVIGTLWNLQGYDSPLFIERFYRSLLSQPGMAAASAMREAQLSFWKEGKSPRSWAAFVMFGDWEG